MQALLLVEPVDMELQQPHLSHALDWDNLSSLKVMIPLSPSLVKYSLKANHLWWFVIYISRYLPFFIL